MCAFAGCIWIWLALNIQYTDTFNWILHSAAFNTHSLQNAFINHPFINTYLNFHHQYINIHEIQQCRNQRNVETETKLRFKSAFSGGAEKTYVCLKTLLLTFSHFITFHYIVWGRNPSTEASRSSGLAFRSKFKHKIFSDIHHMVHARPKRNVHEFNTGNS